VVARTKHQLDRKLNMQRLAESFADISPKEYLCRMVDILADEI
jgi:hypothetical protein